MAQWASERALTKRIDNIENVVRVVSKTDLHHISTDRLESLVDKYKRRSLVSPNDQGLKMRIQFILSEIGMRQMVEDIERDLESDSQ